MKPTFKPMVVGAFALLMFIPAAFAQTLETSVLPVTEPLDVGGTILQPGTYTIRVLRSTADRNKVQITSPDFQTVYATVLTVPHPLEPGEEIPNTTFVYYPASDGMPRALRTWFAPDPEASGGGHDIVYEETRARQLARMGDSRVVAFRDETVMADFDTATLNVVTPQATIETYTAPAPVPTAVIETETETMTSGAIEMPATASNIPLIALLGLLSLAAAAMIRKVRPE